MDEALIRRAQGGDATSFAELLDLHYDTIYRFAWKWCGHAANAEDIAQLACMKLATQPCAISIPGGVHELALSTGHQLRAGLAAVAAAS